MVRLGPGDVRRAEQRHDRPVEGVRRSGAARCRSSRAGRPGGRTPWSARSTGPAPAGVTRSPSAKTPGGRPAPRCRRRARRSAGPHSTSTPQPRRSTRSRARRGEVVGRPVLRRPERRPGIEADDLGEAVEAGPRPRRGRRRPRRRRREQLQSCARRRAAELLGEAVVGVDDRRDDEPPVAVAHRLQGVGEQERPAVAGVADDAAGSRRAGRQGRAEASWGRGRRGRGRWRRSFQRGRQHALRPGAAVVQDHLVEPGAPSSTPAT